MNTRSLHIETLAIGDELLNGKISDTNSTFVANELFKIGYCLVRQTVVADDLSEIELAINECAKRAAVVICFGGLGPTSDDKTAECVAGILNCKLVENLPSKEKLLSFLTQRNRAITPQNLKQVLYPEASLPMLNPVGLAPGFHFKMGSCTFFFLPGVPAEMKALLTSFVLPQVLELGGTSAKILSHRWKCLDIPESEVQRAMDPIEATLPKNAWLGYQTKFPENHLSLYVRQSTNEDIEVFKKVSHQIRGILKPYIYSESDKDLETVILDALAEIKGKIVFAESCTGGLAVHRLTNINGSSNSVFGGFTPYQIAAKKSMLGVNFENPLDSVSAKCSLLLSQNALKATGATISAAITGYVGTSSGTKEDPSGTLYLCVINQGRIFERRIFQPWGNRQEAQWGASCHLLNLVRKSFEK